MKKLLLGTAAATVLALPATPVFAQATSPHSVSANLGLTSNYIFRGISQTGGKPAIQGGFDYGYAAGPVNLYAGTWASNVSWLEDFGAYTSSSLEWDFYGGVSGNFGSSDFTYDVGTIYYYYPGRRNPGVVSADTWELYAGVGWKFLSLKYSYALSDYFGARPTGQKTDGTWYLDFTAKYEIPNTGFAVFGHYGILDVANDGTQIAATEASYNDWKLGASYTIQSGLAKDLEIGAYYTDTDEKNSAVTGTNFYTDLQNYNTAKGTGVIYISKSF